MKESERDVIKVLFIDDELFDEEDSRTSYSIEELERNGGIKVDAAINGSEALRYLSHTRPDIVILDIMMPPGEDLVDEDVNIGRETGFVVLRKIRRKLGLDVPIIILTIYPRRLHEEEMKELNVAEYLAKPVRMRELAELIRYHVEGDGYYGR